MTRRGLLLDRDGVININHGYVGKKEQFEFLPGLFNFLRQLQDRGFRLAILTNQSGVARGYFTEEDHKTLMDWALNKLASQGITIDLTLACFEHPEGKIETYKRESYWRKPNPGMVLDALQRLHLNPSHSVFLGDSQRDLEAAQRGKIKTCLWLTSLSIEVPPGITLVHDYDQAMRAIPFA